MGLFDAPGPTFAWLDAQAGVIASPTLRLVLWGSLAAMISMVLYGWMSAQERIRRGRLEIAEARAQLDDYEGEWEGAQPLLRRLLRVAFAQVGRVAWPSIVASLPLLSLLAWLSTAYSYDYPPPGHVPAIETVPTELRTQWIDGNCEPAGSETRCPRIIVFDGDLPIADIALNAPVPVIHRRRWWNALLENPAGYLPAGAPIESIRVALPSREYLSFGPQWSRWWGILFFVPLVLVSLALKRGLRIA